MAAYAPKKEEIYGFQTYFREVGYYIVRREQYERGNYTFTIYNKDGLFAYIHNQNLSTLRCEVYNVSYNITLISFSTLKINLGQLNS